MNAARHTFPQPTRQPYPAMMTASACEQLAQAERRALVREFLRSVPASEPYAALELVAPDGSISHVTRGALQQRIVHHLRPRMRRIIERQIIGHVSRDQVARELGCSIKTLERDQHEALDLLISALTSDTSLV